MKCPKCASDDIIDNGPGYMSVLYNMECKKCGNKFLVTPKTAKEYKKKKAEGINLKESAEKLKKLRENIVGEIVPPDFDLCPFCGSMLTYQSPFSIECSNVDCRAFPKR